ncbi:MAG: CNNM domain-containing protein [Phycisphaerales bacterium]|nr:CNNM domain-containing protein [Phycisphaerales bacterium]
MDTFGWIIMGLFVLLGVIGSAIYSGSETGLYTLSRVRLDVKAREGNRRARQIEKLIRRPGMMLAVLLLANNICNYLGSYGIASMLDAAGFTPGESVVINAAILVPLLFIFGEVLPKELFRENTDRWSYSCAPLIEWTRRCLCWTGLAPLVAAAGSRLGVEKGNSVSARQRMADLLREGVPVGVLSESQTAMVDRALLLRERNVTMEMVPWAEVVTIPFDASRDDIESKTSEYPHSRFPIVDRDGRVTGVASTLDLMLYPDRRLEDLSRTALIIEHSLTVQVALAYLRDNSQSVAIIMQDGVPVGIVTMKDLVEVLVGELTEW